MSLDYGPQSTIESLVEWTTAKQSGTSFIGMGLFAFLALIGSIFVVWWAYPSISDHILMSKLVDGKDFVLPKNHINREVYSSINETLFNKYVNGLNVLTGPHGSGKTTAIKSLLNNRPLSFYFALRDACDRALRIECFMKDFLAELGVESPAGAQYLKSIPSVKTLDDLSLNELRWLYVQGLRRLRQLLASKEIASLAQKLGIVPVLVFDDAQFLDNLAEEGSDDDRHYGKGLVQELLNIGVLISQEDASANVLIISNYDYAVRYFLRNYDGVQNGRLSEAEVSFGDSIKSVALSFLDARADDSNVQLSGDTKEMIFSFLGGRFSDLSRVPLKNPHVWINVRQEELKQQINHILETKSSKLCTHAKVLRLLTLLRDSKSGHVSLEALRIAIDDSADLCIEELVLSNVITRRNYGLADDLYELGERNPDFYVTAHSPLMASILPDLDLVLTLRIKLPTDDLTEARSLELTTLSVAELKATILQMTEFHPEEQPAPAVKMKLKCASGRLEKDRDLLRLSNDDVIVYEISKPKKDAKQL